MQRMSPLDASFLFLENDNQPMHIGGVAIFEGPAPSHEEVVQLLTSKLHLVPRYRQKVKFLPLGVGLPGWIDDPDFEIEYHIRRTALPAPAARAAGQPGQPPHRRTAGPSSAAVGGVGHRRPGGRSLGDVVQDPPLHDRRRLGR